MPTLPVIQCWRGEKSLLEFFVICGVDDWNFNELGWLVQSIYTCITIKVYPEACRFLMTYVFLVQKDLKLSLNMGDQLEQPLPLTASANEVSRYTSNQPMR